MKRHMWNKREKAEIQAVVSIPIALLKLNFSVLFIGVGAVETGRKGWFPLASVPLILLPFPPMFLDGHRNTHLQWDEDCPAQWFFISLTLIIWSLFCFWSLKKVLHFIGHAAYENLPTQHMLTWAHAGRTKTQAVHQSWQIMNFT